MLSALCIYIINSSIKIAYTHLRFTTDAQVAPAAGTESTSMDCINTDLTNIQTAVTDSTDTFLAQARDHLLCKVSHEPYQIF